MQKGQAHPAAVTSKNMLAAAFIELLQKKNFPDITITEICNRAQIARRTFYRNFNTTSDVICYFVRNSVEEFSKEMLKYADADYYEIVVAYYSFWFSKKDLMTLLSRNGLTQILFIEYLICLEKLPFLCHMGHSSNQNSDEFRFMHAFFAGGLWSLLTFYIANDGSQSPEELAEIITRQFINL